MKLWLTVLTSHCLSIECSQGRLWGYIYSMYKGLTVYIWCMQCFLGWFSKSASPGKSRKVEHFAIWVMSSKYVRLNSFEQLLQKCLNWFGEMFRLDVWSHGKLAIHFQNLVIQSSTTDSYQFQWLRGKGVFLERSRLSVVTVVWNEQVWKWSAYLCIGGTILIFSIGFVVFLLYKVEAI